MKRLIIAAVAGYVAVCTAMYFLQDGLLFHPRANNAASVTVLTPHAWALNGRGISLNGWHIEHRDATRLPLIIYFGGNAQDVARRADDFIDGRHVPANYLFVNYRGYGSSSGAPSQQALFEDALHIFDAALALPHNGKIVAWGRSLGSGIAVHLAANRSLAGVILITPYDSIRAVAEATFPWLPIAFLLRHPFDSAAIAHQVDVPALVLVARNDRVIPRDHALNLAATWGGPAEVIEYDNVHHDSVQEAVGFYPAIRDFVGKL